MNFNLKAPVKSIIFDLGGVLLDIDYDATIKAFAALGIPNFETHFSQMEQSNFFDDWETGKMGREAWLAGMQEACGPAVSPEKIVEAWNAMLGGFPMRRLQLLQQLRSQYNLYLLSNTNEVHEEAFNKILNEQCGVPAIAAFFDKVYYSHRIGMRKPDEAPFLKILYENGLVSGEILFIDDSPQHLETAAWLGLQTRWLRKGETIEENVFR